MVQEAEIAFDYMSRRKQRKVYLIVSLLLKVRNYTQDVQTGTADDNIQMSWYLGTIMSCKCNMVLLGLMTYKLSWNRRPCFTGP